MVYSHTYLRLTRLTTALIILSIFFSTYPTRAAGLPARSNNHLNALPDLVEEHVETSAVNSVTLAEFAAPLSISRVQSNYLAGTTTITFTATNNLPPTLLPETPASASYTETIETLAAFSASADVNTLHQVTLEDSLSVGTTLIDASGNPVQNGNNIKWTLPDIPPFGSVTVTMTLQTPAAGVDFVNLDSGAQVNAVRWGTAVSSVAPPAIIAPNSISAAYTNGTSDADIVDSDMLWKSAQLAQDPLVMYEFVRGFNNDPYHGSLRGTRGTLWGEAGNSADKSSLLIAMLRAAGIPARYRHGSLSNAQAQSLLGGMFPVQSGVAGYLPQGIQTADPVNDPTLISMFSDHWWVEAYLPGGGWTNLDPSFPAAQPGDIFATPAGDGTDRVASLPGSMSYTVDLELEVEQYRQFPIGGANLTSLTPITATYNLAQLASKALTVGHIVVTEAQGGVYSTVTHTYAPFFALAGEDFLTLGDEFQDVLTSFPLASNFTTAEWLKITVKDPYGSTRTFTRELKDLIGLDARTFGGNPTIALPTNNRAFTSFDDAFAAWFLPNQLADTQYATRQQAENAYAVIATAQAAKAVPNPVITPEDSQIWRQAALDYILARNQQYAIAGLEFAKMADPAVNDIESYLWVKMFYDRPRIIITSSASQPDDSIETSIDLRSTEATALVYPGQSTQAEASAQWIKGVVESYYETEVAARLAGAIPVSVARLFDEMHAQGLQPVLITPDTMDMLDLYYTDRDSVAYARQALLEGKSILIPPGSVMLDGEEVVGWWEIDPQSGVAVSVMENGQHTAALDWIILLLEFWDAWDDAGDLAQATAKMWACIVIAVVPALQGNPGAPAWCLEGFKIPNTAWPPWWPDPLDLAFPDRATSDVLSLNTEQAASFSANAAASWRYLPAHLCPIDNCGIEQFVLPYSNRSSIPLPEMLYGYNDRFSGEDQAGSQFSVSNNGDPGSPTFSLETAPTNGSILPGEIYTFDLVADANFDGDVRAWVYAPRGWQVRFNDTGQAEAVPLMGTLPGDYTLQIVAQSVNDPDVIATAQHKINIPDADNLLLLSVLEPNISMPSDQPAFTAASNQTNDGEAEYPESAYRLVIANYSDQDKKLTLNASGLPSGWTILNGAQQTTANFELGANQRTQVGLYILPDSTPAPGTSYTVNIQLSDGQGLVENISIPWSMPAQAHNYIQLSPAILYLGSSSGLDFNVSLENVGNTAGSFPVSADLPPVNASVATLPSPVSLAVGESQIFTATLNTAGLSPGTRFPLVLSSPAPASYTQYSQAMVQIVSPLTEPVFRASDQVGSACTLGEPGLSAALESLALAMARLETSCGSGNCSLDLRDGVVEAAHAAAFYAGLISADLAQDGVINQIAALLATRTANSDILADLADLSEAVASTSITNLLDEVCTLSWYKPGLTWTPAYSATLSNQPAQYSLELTNQGTLPSTYALTLTLPTGVQTFSPTVNPGETSTFPVSLNQAIDGLYDLEANVSVVGEGWMQASASARLNVVDRFVQLTAVNPYPSFVETGVSSTTILADISNIANLALPSLARTTILAPGGGISYSNDHALTILAGAPRSYQLQTVDTSGWAAGNYTVTVDLLNQGGTAVIPDGNGYGYLGVGQALGISHTVSPVVVDPGTVTVTTRITSELLAPVIIPPAEINSSTEGSQALSDDAKAALPPSLPAEALQTTDAITRTDDLAATIVYTGTWTPVTTIAWTRHTSQGSYTVSDVAGDTANFTFNGIWLHLGFATDRFGGQAEILVDGISQGIVDTYSHDIDVASYAYSGFADTAHTLTISVLGASHPNAIGEEVKLDFIDTWDGTQFPDGLVQQTSSRVWRSLDWTDISDSDASGGSYMLNNVFGTAWFPFTGDSVTLIAFANSQGNRMAVAIDGIWQTNTNIYNSTDITRTLSFDNLSPGPHVLQIRRYYNSAHVDAFVTPAIEPGYTSPMYSGIIRYEADHPAILYNGYPMRTMAQSWSVSVLPNASDSTVVGSTTLSDTISFTFDGNWVSIGVRARSNGGYGEVFIDGASYGLIDCTSPNDILRSFQFGGLITGTHTLDIVVLDAPNPLTNNVYLDYIDVWDGTSMPDNFANANKAQDSGRLHYSVSGVDALSPFALQGDYISSGLPNTNSNVWYSFTGDSFTFYGLSRDNTSSQEVFVDGELIDTVNLNYPFSEQVLNFHYTGFDDGPHVVRINNVWEMRVDGFSSNPVSLTQFQPIVEWHESNQTRGASIWGGLHVPVAVGDVTGDGSTEIVVASSNIQSNGELFLLRGDGGDTGDGDPIIWSVPYNIFNGFEHVAAPAIAELDNLPGAEIIHPTTEGLFVYHSDGSIYWFTDTVQSHVFFAAPAVGNLDIDPEPEIVVNMNHDLVVFEPDGSLAWKQTFPAALSMPLLADLNGDGLLDILVHESGTTNIHAFEYNFGNPTLLWSQSVATQFHIYGGPAVVDVDGKQPGGDALPEVAVASQGWLNVLNAEDGSPLWSTQLDDGRSGGVSAADLDGDGEVELVTSMEFSGGQIYAINADGSILWSTTALDNSPLNTSVLDLNNDGLYEVAWNGATQGFTLFNGADGAVLFNEPHLEIVSQTGSDFPVFADVDQDGYGEVVVASQAGLRVFGFDGVWGPARPIWNQHSYHITHVNDDLSIPINEPDSWTVHNTYRTQTTLVNPLPVYSIALTHTVGITGVTVLTGTFNILPDSQSGADYGWDFGLSWLDGLITHTFNSRLDSLQAGDVRLVAQGTQASYLLSSGKNNLTLPPLYVNAAHIIAIDPPLKVIGQGGSVDFSIVLTNTTNQQMDYQLSTVGLPEEWTSLATLVSMPAGTSQIVPLNVSLPQQATQGSYPFNVAVSTGQGGSDQSGATLSVTSPLLEAELSPAERSASTGATVSYTLTITNMESVVRTYDLSGSGLAALSLPAQTSVNAGSSTNLVFNALAAIEGINPFMVEVAEANGFGSAQAHATLVGVGQEQVEVEIAPDPGSGGPGVPTLFDVRIINLGSHPDIFDISLDVPTGWETNLTLLSAPVSSILVGPGAGNAVALQLEVIPAVGTAPGDYRFTVAALSSSGNASDSAQADLQVGSSGVLVEILSGPSSLEPDAGGTWQVRVTNTGNVADTYDLSAFGTLALGAQINPSSVSLVAGQSQTVQLTAGPLEFALPQEYLLGVVGESQADTDIRSQDFVNVRILERQAVQIAWAPATQTVNGALSASFSLVITNTGNLNTSFQITGAVSPGGDVIFETSSLEMPAHSTAVLLAAVDVPQGGVYQVNATVQGGQAQDSASAHLTVIYVSEPPKLYLPLVPQG